MIEHTQESLQVERIDDIPLLMAILYRMRVPAFLDEWYPSHGNWKGELSFGTVTGVWLAYILSCGDHRLSHLQGWVRKHQQVLEGCLSSPVRDLDFHDDRLAWILERLSERAGFSLFEQAMNGNLLRVYQLEPRQVRLDTTTSKTYAGVSEGGLFQYGHSKEHRGDLAQVKLGLASLDPLGLPLVTKVVSGNRADNGMYLPMIEETQASIGRGGKSYIGDTKMDARAIRGTLVSGGDYYLCPLSLKQVSAQELAALIERAVSGQESLTPVLAKKGGKSEMIASGYCYEQTMEAEVGVEQVCWSERRAVVRAEGFARQQWAVLEKKVARALAAILKLNERKGGKRRLSGVELEEAVGRILEKEAVEAVLRVEVVRRTRERIKRKCLERAAEVVIEEEAQVLAEVDQEALERVKQRIGWRVYATNHLDWGVAQVVETYREQYLIERGFARLKGHSLALPPHYLHSEERVEGLLNLLVIGLRLLSLLEYEARGNLSIEEKPEAQELKGLYEGQPQKSTRRPTSESLLQAFKGISLVRQSVAGEIRTSITPLNALQKRILGLLNLSTYLYEGLASDSCEPDLFLSET
jgi:transposase